MVNNYGNFTPAFSLSVQGKNLDQVLNGRLLSLKLEDCRGFEADTLTLSLDDSDGALAIPKRNEKIKLSIGYKESGLVYKGEFVVDEVEHSGTPDVLSIRGRSADMRGSLFERKERTFKETTLGKIIEQIATENSLTPKVSPRLASEQIPHLAQSGESTINLITRLGNEYDAIATVKNGSLLFINRGEGKTTSGQKLPKVIITRAMGDQHRFAINEGDNYQAVRAYYHSFDTGKRGEVLYSGEIKEISDSEQIKTLRHTYQSKAAAQKACKREFYKLARASMAFSLSLSHGNAELIPELPVSVQGFKNEIDRQEWIITKVSHSIDNNGFTSSIECELKGT